MSANESTGYRNVTDKMYSALITAQQVPSLDELNAAEVDRLIPTIVYLLLISVFGTLGNSLVIHIYRTRYKISNSQCFILCLSAVDLFSCSVVIPLEVATILEQYNFEELWLCKWSRCFNTLGTCSSSFILLFIAIDRFRKVCKPFGWQIKANIAKFLCVLSIVLGLFVSWPAIFVYGKKQFDIPQFNITGTECSTADEMNKTSFPFMYAVVFGLLFIAGIVAMSILYCCIGHEVRKHAQKMEELGRSMSIPITSSILAARNSAFSSDIDPEPNPRYEVQYKKGDENCNKKSLKREKQRQSKKFDNSRDEESDLERKDFELSYAQDSREKNDVCVDKDLKVHKTVEENDNQTNCCSVDRGVKSKVNSEQVENKSKKHSTCNSDSDDSGIKGSTNDVSDMKGKAKCKQQLSVDEIPEKQSGEEKCKDVFPNGERKLEVSPSSSEEILAKQPRTIRKSISSIGSRISHVILRLTSITSADRSQNCGTLKKSQFLKQARARKTAFLMFVITLAYILSFMPHLVLMLARQIKENFVDELSDTNRAVYKFFLRSYFLNCAVNPVIYSVCDSRFRRALKEIVYFCFRCKSSYGVK